MPTLAVVTLKSVTGMEKDNVTNNWVIGTLDEDHSGANHVAVLDAIEDFYTTDSSLNETAVGKYISDVISRTTPAVIELYDISNDLSGTPHGSPYSSQTFTMPAPVSSDALPSEIAVDLQLEAEGRDDAPVEQGAEPSTRPKQRHTGRVKIGPLVTTVLETVDGVVRPSVLFRNRLLASAEKLHDTLTAIDPSTGPSPRFYLGVWSRADATVRPVHFVSSDNAFDNVRKRGEAPTLRIRVTV